jgi:protein TonB
MKFYGKLRRFFVFLIVGLLHTLLLRHAVAVRKYAPDSPIAPAIRLVNIREIPVITETPVEAPLEVPPLPATPAPVKSALPPVRAPKKVLPEAPAKNFTELEEPPAAAEPLPTEAFSAIEELPVVKTAVVTESILVKENVIAAEEAFAVEAAPAGIAVSSAPPVSAPPPAVSTKDNTASKLAAETWVKRNYDYISRRISRFLLYPPQAKRTGTQGSVDIVFTIYNDGSVGNLSVRKSSGSETLDTAALAAVRSAAPFPAPPAPARLVCPVVFSLR